MKTIRVISACIFVFFLIVVSSHTPTTPNAQAVSYKSKDIIWKELTTSSTTYHTISVVRAKVYGGWLLHTDRGGMTFIPDPSHLWLK